MAIPLHSRLPPSSASRWTVCTASVGFIESNAAILPKESSVFADEGTLAHAVAAHLLGKGAMPEGEVTPEMHGFAKDYAEFVLGQMDPGNTLLVERRVPLFYLPSQRGTVDAAITRPDSLTICDLKYGAGVGVYAKENKQLAIYAESLLRELDEVQDVPDSTLVNLVIYQPRDRNDPEPVRQWPITRKELREFCAGIEASAKTIETGRNLNFVADPDKQCRFCPAKGICRHYASHGLVAIPDAVPEKIQLQDPASLTREQRIKVIAAKKTLESWLEAVENQEVTELMAGTPTAGFKLVAGKTNRQWTNEAEADQLLSTHLSAEERRKPWEVISIAQAEKKLKGKELSTKFQNRLADLTTRPEGKPTLVPEDDPRPALVFNAAAGLQDQDAVDSVI